MRLMRFIASVLFGLLLGWGGLASPDARVAVAHEAHGVAHQAEQERSSHCAAEADRHEHGDHGDCPSEAPDQGCCVKACGPVALEPVHLQVNAIRWAATRLRIVTDDMLTDRSVSPLRRPPRTVA